MIYLNRAGRFVIFGAVLFVLCATASAQSGPVSYTVSLDKRPTSHFINVTLTVNSGGAASIDVAMPAWSPGGYGIHNAWRNVQEFRLTTKRARRLSLKRSTSNVAHNAWGRANNYRKVQVYLRTDYTDELCYLRGPNVFMYVVGKRPYPARGPVKLKLEAPGSWRIQTGMDAGQGAKYLHV